MKPAHHAKRCHPDAAATHAPLTLRRGPAAAGLCGGARERDQPGDALLHQQQDAAQLHAGVDQVGTRALTACWLLLLLAQRRPRMGEEGGTCRGRPPSRCTSDARTIPPHSHTTATTSPPQLTPPGWAVGPTSVRIDASAVPPGRLSRRGAGMRARVHGQAPPLLRSPGSLWQRPRIVDHHSLSPQGAADTSWAVAGMVVVARASLRWVARARHRHRRACATAAQASRTRRPFTRPCRAAPAHAQPRAWQRTARRSVCCRPMQC